MGKIISSYIFPHPPIIVPEVGRGREREAADTINAVKKAALKIAEEKPETIIITSPHAPLFQDYIYISTAPRLCGDFGRFGSGGVKLEFSNNVELVERIIRQSGKYGIHAGGLGDNIARKYGISRELDHGALVPLYFVRKEYKDFKLVHMSTAGLPLIGLYKFGKAVSAAVDELGDERVVFIASGDLSHRLSYDAPYGYSERGKEFDRMLVECVEKSDVESLLGIDGALCENAGECGLRSFVIMYGALDGRALKPEVYSYEGPFGVGYSVARIEVGQPDPVWEKLDEIKKKQNLRMEEIRKSESPHVSLARQALETYVKHGRIIGIPENLPAGMLEERAGTFVSIKKHGQLRGCIGTTAPTRKNVAEEIIHNAISAGCRDPRFSPVEEDELGSLVYSVDVLKKPEPITSMEELDVKRYGVIVKSGMRSGLLLPDLNGVDTPEKQVAIALQKANIRPGEEYRMERFEVVRYK